MCMCAQSHARASKLEGPQNREISLFIDNTIGESLYLLTIQQGDLLREFIKAEN